MGRKRESQKFWSLEGGLGEFLKFGGIILVILILLELFSNVSIFG